MSGADSVAGLVCSSGFKRAPGSLQSEFAYFCQLTVHDLLNRVETSSGLVFTQA